MILLIQVPQARPVEPHRQRVRVGRVDPRQRAVQPPPGPDLLRRQGEDHLRSDLGLQQRGVPDLGEQAPELHPRLRLRRGSQRTRMQGNTHTQGFFFVYLDPYSGRNFGLTQQNFSLTQQNFGLTQPKLAPNSKFWSILKTLCPLTREKI